jgi:Mitochondrial mRNA-processing protein COX24, C-terminal
LAAELGAARGYQARRPDAARQAPERGTVGSVIKKRRKRMAKKKHRKLLKKTRIQRRRQGK